jgi:hypothetical protein
MVKKLLLVAAIIVGGLFYGGCSAMNQPIYNVANSQVDVGKKLTLAQVERAILQAGASRGWAMKKVNNGLITATYSPRNLMAQLNIKYSASSYSITYKDSQGLNYDGSNIHKNYNTWIRNLDTAIQNNLMMMY